MQCWINTRCLRVRSCFSFVACARVAPYYCRLNFPHHETEEHIFNAFLLVRELQCLTVVCEGQWVRAGVGIKGYLAERNCEGGFIVAAEDTPDISTESTQTSGIQQNAASCCRIDASIHSSSANRSSIQAGINTEVLTTGGRSVHQICSAENNFPSKRLLYPEEFFVRQ